MTQHKEYTLRGKKLKISTGAVWEGPAGPGPNGGVTFSLLSRFLVCRERFRCLVVEGLRPHDKFNPRIEYGQMWHECEEALAASGGGVCDRGRSGALGEYALKLARKYPMDREQIDHWRRMTAEFFQRYAAYWADHPDVKARRPLLQEQVFDVPYRLPSGRAVRLRGKWDSVDLVGKGREAGVWDQENKTKSKIDQEQLTRQCSFDLQTSMYLIALDESRRQHLNGADVGLPEDFLTKAPIAGVRYNCVRRPAHKSVESAVKKYEEDLADGRAGEWFARWNVAVTPADLERFRTTCLDPILENLCNWWTLQTTRDLPLQYLTGCTHWRHPFGVYNVLDEGGASDLDAYLDSGSLAGLTRVENLFPELTSE